MTNAVTAIMDQLVPVFAEMDARVLAAAQIWAVERVAAIKDFKAANTARAFGDQARYYNELFRIAGGKSWYNVFNGRNAKMVAELVTKNCDRVAQSRNASIAAKLYKAGVTSASGLEFERTSDGFNGRFVLETNKGRKVATIQTIYAGGYNIQCLHLRVLVKIK